MMHPLILALLYLLTRIARAITIIVSTIVIIVEVAITASLLISVVVA